jgi:hypothetical protein
VTLLALAEARATWVRYSCRPASQAHHGLPGGPLAGRARGVRRTRSLTSPIRDAVWCTPQPRTARRRAVDAHRSGKAAQHKLRIRVKRQDSRRQRLEKCNEILYRKPILQQQNRSDEGNCDGIELQTSSDSVNRISRALQGISDVTWHTLRHTFASRLANSGVDIVTVKELLGHSGISVTMRYAHTNIESKRAAVEKLGGFGDNLVTVSPQAHQAKAVLSLNRVASYNVSRA